MSTFSLQSGISAEDFLCIPELDEDECVPSGLDGDETAHKQVRKGPVPRAVLRLRRVCR